MKSKARECLEKLVGMSKDQDLAYSKNKEATNKYYANKVDLALSELRGLVMGMRKRGCMGKECSCVKEDDKTFNRAVEAIADELFGET